jgi:hypothetical protein
VLEVEEEARRARAGAGKPAGGVVLSGVAGATWRGEEGPVEAGQAVGATQRENREREGLEVDDKD